MRPDYWVDYNGRHRRARRRRLLRFGYITLVLVAATAAAGGAGYALSSKVTADPQMIQACKHRLTGLLRVVSRSSDCRTFESPVSWSVVGPVGPQGPPGAPGAPGAPGQSGAKGDKGDPGDQGIQGLPGVQGQPGTKGDKGDPGTDGKDGAPGLKGDKGEPGEPGAPGAPGAPGTKGEKGDLGPTGPSHLYVARRAYFSLSKWGTDFPEVFTDEEALALDLPAGEYSVMAKFDTDPTTSGLTSCRLETSTGVPLNLYQERSNSTLGTTLTTWADLTQSTSLRILCSGGGLVLTGSHLPGHGRILGATDLLIQALRVGDLTDVTLPDVSEER